MIPQIPRTSADMLVDNIAYASDMLNDMIDKIMSIKRCLPPIDAMRDIAFGGDFNAIYDQNSIMSDTAALVWSIEQSKSLLNNIGAEIMEAE